MGRCLCRAPSCAPPPGECPVQLTLVLPAMPHACVPTFAGCCLCLCRWRASWPACRHRGSPPPSPTPSQRRPTRRPARRCPCSSAACWRGRAAAALWSRLLWWIWSEGRSSGPSRTCVQASCRPALHCKCSSILGGTSCCADRRALAARMAAPGHHGLPYRRMPCLLAARLALTPHQRCSHAFQLRPPRFRLCPWPAAAPSFDQSTLRRAFNAGRYVRPRVALIGAAAHPGGPLAGPNPGLADAQALAAAISRAGIFFAKEEVS